jgi:hypothetical protein
MPASTTELPVRHPAIHVIRTCLWERIIRFRDGTATVDVSGRTFDSWLLAKGADPDTDRIQLTVDGSSAADGDVALSLASAATAALIAGAQYTWAFVEMFGSEPDLLWRGDVVVGDPNA